MAVALDSGDDIAHNILNFLAESAREDDFEAVLLSDDSALDFDVGVASRLLMLLLDTIVFLRDEDRVTIPLLPWPPLTVVLSLRLDLLFV